MKRNALVAQSGGPSPVINSSLQGVIEGCRAFPDRIGTLFAAWHGIEGVLQEELVDLTRQPRKEVSLLGTTPAAGVIGTRTTMLVGGCMSFCLIGLLFVPGVRDPERQLGSRALAASR